MIYRYGLVLLLLFLPQTVVFAGIPYPADFQGEKLDSYDDEFAWSFDFESIQPSERQIREGSAAGDMFCQYVLANDKLSCGQEDYDQALALLEQSGAQGFAPALFRLGCIYEAGLTKYEPIEGKKNHFIGVGELIHPDFAKALAYYQKAAQAGSPSGQYRLGLFCLNGLSVKKDPVRAEELFRQAAKGGEKNAEKWVNQRDKQLRFEALSPDQTDAAALLEIAQVQKERYIEKKTHDYSDYRRLIAQDAEFLPTFERAAQAGSARAQYLYGIFLTKIDPIDFNKKRETGERVWIPNIDSDLSFDDENARKGLEWVRKSAEQGYQPAELALGIFLLNGIGYEDGKDDPQSGFKQILKVALAEQAAQLAAQKKAEEENQAQEKARIEQAKKEASEANRSFSLSISLSVNQSDPSQFPACTIAGFCYALGIGTEPDEQKAFELLKSAKGLESRADLYCEIAKLFDVGTLERLQWLLKAADNGGKGCSGLEQSEMYSELAEAMIRGDKIPRDDQRAFGLLSQSGANGDGNVSFLRAVCYSMGWGTKPDEAKAQAILAEIAKNQRESLFGSPLQDFDAPTIEHIFTISKAYYCLHRGETDLAGKQLLGTNLLSMRAFCLAAGWGVEKDEAQALKIVRENYGKIGAELERINKEKPVPGEQKTQQESLTDARLFDAISDIANFLADLGNWGDLPPTLQQQLMYWNQKRSQARSEDEPVRRLSFAPLPKSHQIPVPWVRYCWDKGLYLNIKSSSSSRSFFSSGNLRLDAEEEGGNPANAAIADASNKPLKPMDEQFQQGLRYFNGQDVEKDEAKGRALIEQAAKAGCQTAGSWLWLHNALDRLDKACETGDANALYERGALNRQIYLKDFNDWSQPERDVRFARFVDDVQQAAEKGNPAALYELAFVQLKFYPKRMPNHTFLHEKPDKTAQTAARELLRLSAEKGYAPAMLAAGLFVIKSGDSAKAKDGFQWLEKAAKAGNEKIKKLANEVLAFCCLTGIGTEPDEQKALAYLKKTNDEYDAQKMYLFVAAKLIDHGNAFQSLAPWIDKALKGDYDDSDGTLRTALATALFLADEKNRDDARAVRILNQLNEERLLDSSRFTFLSFCYAEGIGTDKDPVLAKKWFDKSGYSSEDDKQTVSTQACFSAALYMIRRDFDKAGAALLKCGRTDFEIFVYSMGWSVPRDDDKAIDLARKYTKTDEGKKHLESVLLAGALYAQLVNGPIPKADDTSDARVCELICAIIMERANSVLQLGVSQPQDEPYQSRALFWTKKAAQLGSPCAKHLISEYEKNPETATQSDQETKTDPLPWIKYEWSFDKPVLNHSGWQKAIWELDGETKP